MTKKTIIIQILITLISLSGCNIKLTPQSEQPKKTPEVPGTGPSSDGSTTTARNPLRSPASPSTASKPTKPPKTEAEKKALAKTCGEIEDEATCNKNTDCKFYIVCIPADKALEIENDKELKAKLQKAETDAEKNLALKLGTRLLNAQEQILAEEYKQLSIEAEKIYTLYLSLQSVPSFYQAREDANKKLNAVRIKRIQKLDQLTKKEEKDKEEAENRRREEEEEEKEQKIKNHTNFIHAFMYTSDNKIINDTLMDMGTYSQIDAFNILKNIFYNTNINKDSNFYGRVKHAFETMLASEKATEEIINLFMTNYEKNNLFMSYDNKLAIGYLDKVITILNGKHDSLINYIKNNSSEDEKNQLKVLAARTNSHSRIEDKNLKKLKAILTSAGIIN